MLQLRASLLRDVFEVSWQSQKTFQGQRKDFSGATERLIHGASLCGSKFGTCSNAYIGIAEMQYSPQMLTVLMTIFAELKMADPGLRSYLYSQAEKTMEELLSKGCISPSGHAEILKILHQEQGGGQQMGYPAPYPGQYQQYPQNNAYMQPYQPDQYAQVIPFDYAGSPWADLQESIRPYPIQNELAILHGGLIVHVVWCFIRSAADGSLMV